MHQLNKFEMRPGPDSREHEIQGAETKVDVAGGLAAAARGDVNATAIGNGAGIELDTISSLSKELADSERFMAEMLTVQIQEASDENEPAFAELTVNGIYKCCFRGEVVELRRYHVAALAHAKQLRVMQKKVVNADGSMGFEEKAVLRQTFPFSVLHDPNPAGPKWLVGLLRSPA